MTPTLHPTLAGLLRAVCEQPADDDVRLVLADWYEENGQEERGALIRIGCELAALGGCCLKRPLSTEAFEPLTYCCRACDLRRRERALLPAIPIPEVIWNVCNPTGATFTGPAPWTFRRGFIALVSCKVVDWCGQKCPGMGCVDGVLTYHHTEKRVCQVCHGTGRTGANGPAIVQAAPIERVTLSDAMPEYVGGGIWTWRPAVLPDFISRLIPVLDLNPPGWYTEQVAVEHLSHAARDWARQQAGLPTLS